MSRHSLHFPWLLSSSECDKISSLPVFDVDEKFTHQVIYFKVSVYPKIDHFSKKKFFSFSDRSYCNLTLPPQGFGPEAKTRGGIIVSPAYTCKECVNILIAPAGFWPRGQNPRRHPRVPRVYTYKEFKEYKEVEESKKCVGSRGSFLHLMKLGAHGCLG